MAEIVVTSVITVLCEKLISGDLVKFARSEGIDSQLNKWKKNLRKIQDVLADASQKQIKDRAVQSWVNDLQDLAFDIDDVLDDLATEALKRNLNQEAHASSSSSKVLKIIPTCCTNFTPSNIMYGRKMSAKLDEITDKLRDLVDQKNDLGLNVNVNVERSNITERRLETTSIVVEPMIMGRDGVKEELLEKLLGNKEGGQNVSIVSIVGMGGIGKTTLARLLYNEDKVKDHFEVRAWVCISEEFDVFNTSKSIFQAVTGRSEDFANLDLLHVALKEKLTKKRFLLVLDDVWNEDPDAWKLLQGPLLVGAPGSKVIATTRHIKVASVMKSKETHCLDVLSNDDALSLFAQHALDEKNFDKHPTLMSLGEGIVKKCGRLPLALETLGSALMGKRNVDDWEKLLNSEIWDIDDGNKILPALRLSYYRLPLHLKQLFAYCSLIPKDYVFYKNKLVLLWMAEGFLSQTKGNESMERLGDQYFEELKSRSFFQLSTDEELGYTMHDLINDLATDVAREFSFRLDAEMDVSKSNETFERFRHLSLVGPRSGSYRKFKELQRAKRLRTFLLMSAGCWRNDGLLVKVDELLPELQFLRVLSVTDSTLHHNDYSDPVKITTVPPSIGSLKHLRYLNFSYTGITCLPEQVGDLYNLQSLFVHNCRMLFSLPGSFARLINLRHFDISHTPLVNKLPLGIGGLTTLQTLSKVIVEEANGFKISDLKDLSDLQGRLSIKGLDKVINPLEAKDANLHQKKGLDVLEMEWSDSVFVDSGNEKIQDEVLTELRPHPRLKVLKISSYRATRFPNWVSDPSFDQLTEITLCGCRTTQLPTLGHLQSLKKLSVQMMNDVKSVGFEFIAPTNSFVGNAFPSLEVLEFTDMQCWHKWEINIGGDHATPESFPRLHKISISCCPELVDVSIGSIPSLRVLDIEKCPEALFRSMVGSSSSLVQLTLQRVKGLTQLHGEDLMHLGALEVLKIIKCEDLRYLWERESEACKRLVSLQGLHVWNCEKLFSSAEKEDNFGIGMECLKVVSLNACESLGSYNCPNTVESLYIGWCYSMASLTFSAVQKHPSSVSESIISDCDDIQPIPSKGHFLPMSRLTSLTIEHCNYLKSISHFQSLTSLEELEISDCPSMDYSFPCGLWPPNLRILKIGVLNKPMSKWGPQNFPTSLVNLKLYGKDSGVVSFSAAEDVRNATTTPSSSSSSSSFLLPPFLVSLELDGFEDVESFSEALQHLPSLKTLQILHCPKITDLKTTSGPSNLSITVIGKDSELDFGEMEVDKLKEMMRAILLT